MNALVTGASGFVGRHLVRALLDARWNVTTLDARPRPHPKGVRAIVTDLARVERLRGLRPDVTFHLASIARPVQCDADPPTAFRVNAAGSLRVLRALPKRCRFIHISSGDVYGRPQTVPTSESEPLRPANAYGASKLCAESMLLAERDDVVILRPFNHIGPGQSPGFVAADFASQVALAEARRRSPTIRVGRLSPVRDFLDVRDVVRAYLLAALDLSPGIYNIASGERVSIGDLLRMLLGLARIPIRVCHDRALHRRGEPDVRIGDSTRFREATGWRPTIPLRRTLADLLEFERARLRISRHHSVRDTI